MLLVAIKMIAMILLGLLRSHRTDLKPSQGMTEVGDFSWQLAALSPRNYTPRGRRLLVVTWIALGAWMATFIAFGMSL